MPGGGRTAEPDLRTRIVEAPWAFDFFQLVHLLETEQGSAVRLGEAGPYRAERLRLRPDPSLVFQPSDVRSVEPAGEVERRRGEGWQWRVTVAFMGLYGAASPTPTYLSELIGFTDVDAEPLVDFLDLFNHRILSQYYRAWVKYRYPYRYQRGAKDAFSSYALSFVGLREPEIRPLARLPVARLLGYLGLLSMRTRPAAGLERMLGHYLRVPVEVERWQLRWVPVPPEGRNRLGRANSTLGVDCTVGERVQDRTGKFRVVVGPLPFEEYRGSLPDTPRYADLQALTRLWTVDRFEHDVEVRLRGEEVPPLKLDSASPGRLGWTSWVCAEGGVAGTPGVVFSSPAGDGEGRA